MKKQSLKDKYKNIKTPEDLLDFMQNDIRFGLYGTNKKIYDTSDLDAFELANDIYWSLSSPTDTLKYGYGQCFDQVELEREWFIKNGYECKTMYITFLVNEINSYPTHAYLLYKKNGKWYWFENCDKSNIGIHEYNNIEELITDQMTKHVMFAQKFNPLDERVLNCLHIYQYNKPKYGLNSKEFVKFVLNSEEVPIVE